MNESKQLEGVGTSYSQSQDVKDSVRHQWLFVAYQIVAIIIFLYLK